VEDEGREGLQQGHGREDEPVDQPSVYFILFGGAAVTG